MGIHIIRVISNFQEMAYQYFLSGLRLYRKVAIVLDEQK